jgi:hypothetical protein
LILVVAIRVTKIRSRALGVILIALMACSDAELYSGDAWTGIPESSTARVIQMDSAAAASPSVIRLVEEMRITSDSIEPLDLSVSEAGDVYVLDGSASKVWIYDSSGQLIRAWGGRGGGPREFVDAQALASWRDTVFVVTKSRVHAFLVDGAPLPSTLIKGFGERVDAVGTRSGLVLVTRRLGKEPSYQDSLIVEFPRNVQGAGHTYVGFADVARFRVDDIYATPALFGPRLRLTVAPDGVIMVNRGAPYKLEMYSAGGEGMERWEAGVKRVPTTQADFSQLESYLVAHAPQLADMDAGRSIRKGFRVVPKAKHRPVLGDMIASNDRAVLVRRLDGTALPYVDSVMSSEWDLLESGSVIGKVTLPEQVRPAALRNRRLYTIEADSSASRSIVRYRLELGR